MPPRSIDGSMHHHIDCNKGAGLRLVLPAELGSACADRADYFERAYVADADSHGPGRWTCPAAAAAGCSTACTWCTAFATDDTGKTMRLWYAAINAATCNRLQNGCHVNADGGRCTVHCLMRRSAACRHMWRVLTAQLRAVPCHCWLTSRCLTGR